MFVWEDHSQALSLFLFCLIACRYGGRYRDDRGHRGYDDRQKPSTEYGSRGYYEFFYWSNNSILKLDVLQVCADSSDGDINFKTAFAPVTVANAVHKLSSAIRHDPNGLNDLKL